jgi:hypothetical protein
MARDLVEDGRWRSWGAPTAGSPASLLAGVEVRKANLGLFLFSGRVPISQMKHPLASRSDNKFSK